MTEDVMTMQQTRDIIHIGNQDLIVVGFFTPDYRPLAEQLAGSLAVHETSYHLYSVGTSFSGRAQITRQKPTILLKAINEYPTSTLLLMDVDCITRARLEEVLRLKGNIAISFAKKRTKNGFALRPGSRVMMVRPSEESIRFLRSWQERCAEANAEKSDEGCLIDTVCSAFCQFSFSTLPPHLSGKEIRKANADDVVVHDSAHDKTRRFWKLRKSVQKIFWQGRDYIYKTLLGRSYSDR